MLPSATLPPDLVRRYAPMETTVRAGGRTFTMMAVPDINRLVDEIDPALFAQDERFPYWAELWTSSLALAAYCLNAPALRGASVLELGCGLGLAGIAAATAGADVTLTDYEPDALAFARWNVERNLPGALAAGRVAVQLMDWRTPAAGARFDFVIGADILYERRSFNPLLAVCDRMLSPGGCAVFTDPERTTGTDFAASAAQRGFRVSSTIAPAPPHDGVRTVVRYELRRASS